MLIAGFLLAVPCVIQAEVLYLKDGSVLVGTLIKAAADTLYFKPSYGGQVKFAKSEVLKIHFSDSIRELQGAGMGERSLLPGASSAEPGSLLVSFDGLKLSSKIVVHRGKDMSGHETANTIESLLMVDGFPVASYADSITDKKIRNGPDTVLKNTIRLSDFRVQLSPGPHTCVLIVKNSRNAGYEDAFEFEPLNVSLDFGDVIIYPGRKAHFEIGQKRGVLRLGKPKLYIK